MASIGVYDIYVIRAAADGLKTTRRLTPELIPGVSALTAPAADARATLPT